MATRPKGYGLTAEISTKIDGKFDRDLAQEAFFWIEEVTGKPVQPAPEDVSKVQEALSDGVALCNLANVIQPGAVKKINSGGMAFKKMENISNFLTFCENFGVARHDLFQTVDLFEGQNIPQVIDCLHALGRKVQKKCPKLPCLGPKESEKAPRTFTEEQIQASKGVIGLQMGTNRGASQAGMNFGLQRQIIKD